MVGGHTSEAIGQWQLDRGEVGGHATRAIDLLQIRCRARAINEAIGKGLEVRDYILGGYKSELSGL